MKFKDINKSMNYLTKRYGSNEKILTEAFADFKARVIKFLKEFKAKVVVLFRRWLDFIAKKLSMVGRYTNDIISYNVENKTILTPYEIVVLLGRPNSSIMSQLSPFIENGHKYGLYFFALYSKEESDAETHSFLRIIISTNFWN